MQQGIHEKVSQLIDADKLKQILEAALLAADEPLTVDQFVKLFRDDEVESETIRADIRDALQALETQTEDRGYELIRVASGYRYQVRQELSTWVSRLWEEKPPRYSRALLETLALVAYKQPVTRGDIEEVRGVSVSQSIMRTLVERGWIRVVGQREVPGHPAMYGTTRAFLDYFNLKSLDQLPPLPEIRELIEPVIVAENLAADAAANDNSPQPAAGELSEEDSPQLEEHSADLDAALTDDVDTDFEDETFESLAVVEPTEESGAGAVADVQVEALDVSLDVQEAPEQTAGTEQQSAPEALEVAEVVQLPSAKR